MEDKVVLVTGSSSGIGEATVLGFSKLGYKIIVHGTNEERVRQVAAKCLEVSPKQLKPLEVLGDLRERKTAEILISESLEKFGRLDILVNNAGLFQVSKIDSNNAYDQYKDLMNINLDSAVLLTTLAIPHLKKTKGCIINISSNLHSKCVHHGFAYCTAKAALTMFTKSIAVDLAPDIRVNSISPGPIATLMSSRCNMDVDSFRSSVGKACLTNRVGEAAEVARLVLFLASSESAFITGSDFIIDGGSSIKPEGKVMGQE